MTFLDRIAAVLRTLGLRHPVSFQEVVRDREAFVDRLVR